MPLSAKRASISHMEMTDSVHKTHSLLISPFEPRQDVLQLLVCLSCLFKSRYILLVGEFHLEFAPRQPYNGAKFLRTRLDFLAGFVRTKLSMLRVLGVSVLDPVDGHQHVSRFAQITAMDFLGSPECPKWNPRQPIPAL